MTRENETVGGQSKENLKNFDIPRSHIKPANEVEASLMENVNIAIEMLGGPKFIDDFKRSQGLEV